MRVADSADSETDSLKEKEARQASFGQAQEIKIRRRGRSRFVGCLACLFCSSSKLFIILTVVLNICQLVIIVAILVPFDLVKARVRTETDSSSLYDS